MVCYNVIFKSLVYRQTDKDVILFTNKMTSTSNSKTLTNHRTAMEMKTNKTKLFDLDFTKILLKHVPVSNFSHVLNLLLHRYASVAYAYRKYFGKWNICSWWANAQFSSLPYKKTLKLVGFFSWIFSYSWNSVIVSDF